MKKTNGAIKIKAIEMGSLLSYQAGNREYLDMSRVVLDKSLFTDYMLKNGMKLNKLGNSSNDFIMCKFGYGAEGLSKQQVREKYYTENFTIDWTDYYDRQDVLKINRMSDGKRKEEAIAKRDKRLAKDVKHEVIEYVMLFRSTGKAKVGDCVFINAKLYHKANEYLTMNIDTDKIVEMSAYKSLACGCMIDTINIDTKHILVLEDIDTYTTEQAIVVKAIEGQLVAQQEEYDVSNTMWDGMCLIDEATFSKLDKHITGFAYLRSRFFKACGFRCDIQKWFKDYYKVDYETATITNMIGQEIRVRDIEIITTNNAVKIWKFFADKKEAYNHWCEKMKEEDNKFCVVKTAHKSKYGNMQRMSYQGVNSLSTTDRDKLHTLAQPSIDYCNKLKTDDTAFIDYLSINDTAYSINGVLTALARHNNDILRTSYFSKQRSEIVSDLKRKKLMQGKLFVDGDNLTYVGNSIALLYHAVGEDYSKDTTLVDTEEGIACYTTRFADGERLGAYRNPHNSPNNYVALVNHRDSLIEKYFPKLGDNVVMINTINNSIQARCNGMDEDSDFVLVSPMLYDYAIQCMREYPTIINAVKESGSSNYSNTPEGYANMDNDINKYQMGIGRTANIAQLALTYYYDEKSKGIDYDLRELQDVFVIMSVMSQLYIDSAKRTYEIALNEELERIASLSCMQREHTFPKFLVSIKQSAIKINNKEQRKQAQERIIKRSTYYNCPMEIVADIIDKEVTYKRVNNKLTNIQDYFIKINSNKYNKGQVTKVESIITEYNNKMRQIAMCADTEEYKDLANELTEEMLEELRGIKLSNIAYNRIIYRAINNNSDICSRVLMAMYQYDSDKFLAQWTQK